MGHLIGYARVSTTDQDFSLQLEALRQAGCRDAWIFRDTTSGTPTARPGLEACLRALEPTGAHGLHHVCDQRLSVADICQTLRISQATFYRYVALGKRAAEGR